MQWARRRKSEHTVVILSLNSKGMKPCLDSAWCGRVQAEINRAFASLHLGPVLGSELVYGSRSRDKFDLGAVGKFDVRIPDAIGMEPSWLDSKSHGAKISLSLFKIRDHHGDVINAANERFLRLRSRKGRQQ